MKCTILLAMSATLLIGFGSTDANAQSSEEQILGAIAGGALGSTIGDGDGGKAAIVIGAIIGYRLGERLLNPHDRTDFLSLNSNDLYRFCRRQVPYEYDRRENVRRMWIQGCVDRLQTQQLRLEQEAYEDGLNGSSN